VRHRCRKKKIGVRVAARVPVDRTAVAVRAVVVSTVALQAVVPPIAARRAKRSHPQ
jgi:hypothetical protein